jgi:hypothetical protein
MNPETVVRDKVAFDITEHGYRFVATYLTEPKGDALIEIFRGEELVRSALWPAYKIWNIAAHTPDIAADLDEGLTVAGSNGLGGNCSVAPHAGPMTEHRGGGK